MEEGAMLEEWMVKGKILQEVDILRSRVARLEQVQSKKRGEEAEVPGWTFNRFFVDAAEGMLLADVEKQQFIAGNRAVCRMLGRNPEEITNLGFADVYARKDLAHITERSRRQTNSESIFTADAPVKRVDGSILLVDIISFTLTLDGKTCLLSVFKETFPQKAKSIQQRNASTDSRTSRSLTGTEIKVLQLIVSGMSNKEIAQLFHRSVRTIENHRSHLMKKLVVDNSVELVKRAVALGLVELEDKHRDRKTT
jgi:PAS domain S-box-containing protein